MIALSLLKSYSDCDLVVQLRITIVLYIVGMKVFIYFYNLSSHKVDTRNKKQKEQKITKVCLGEIISVSAMSLQSEQSWVISTSSRVRQETN